MRKFLTLVVLGISVFSSPSAHALSDACQKAVGAEHYQDIVKDCLVDANSGNAEAQFQVGHGYYTSKKYQQAVSWFKKAAAAGSEKAMSSLGTMYLMGWGVAQDYKQAFRWYREAADKGFADAQFNLAAMYLKGWGVAQDYVEATKWYETAARQGHIKAQFYVGTLYLEGKEGVKQDYKQAFHWLEKAADAGLADAMSSLGTMYLKGWGVTQNYTDAVKWYQQAANKGLSGAQFNFAVMYLKGWGVTQNYTDAVKWYQQAALQGHTKAQKALKKIEAIAALIQQGIDKDTAECFTAYAQKQYDNVIPLCTPIAKQGNIEAQLITADAYLKQYHIDGSNKTNNEQGIFWYQQAINAGSEQAIWALIENYRYENITLLMKEATHSVQKANNDKITILLQKAAQKHNSPAAYYALGNIYLTANVSNPLVAIIDEATQNSTDTIASSKPFQSSYDTTFYTSIEQDDEKAISYFTIAYELGVSEAATTLGKYYLKKAQSSAAEKDRLALCNQAFSWFHKAGKQGDIAALTYIGYMLMVTNQEKPFTAGIVVQLSREVDSKRGFMILQLAGNAGNREAQYLLAKLYAQQTPADYVQSLKWLVLSNVTHPKGDLLHVVETATSPQRKEAERLVAIWKPQKPDLSALEF